MKTKLHFLIISFFAIITINSQNYPYSVYNSDPSSSIYIRSGSPCTSSTAVTSIAPNKKLVASSFVSNSCSYDWYKVDIPLTSTPTTNYYVATGTNLMACSAPTPYVEVYNTAGAGLFVRTTAGSGNVTISGVNAKIWDGQRFATTGISTTYGGYTWYEIYLPNSCSQSTGWSSGQYLTFHSGQSCATSCTTPGTPTNLSASVIGQNSANFSWSAGSPSGSATVTYYWVVGTSPSVTYGGGIAQGTTTSTSASTTLLSSNTTYYLRVYAYTSCNNTQSGYGTSSSFTTQSPSCTTPGTPGNLTVSSIGQTTANFTWTAGSPTGSPIVTYYWVVGTNASVTYGNGVAQGYTTGTTASTSSLSCNTTYYLRVHANTSCNNTNSGYGTSSSFTTSSCSSTGVYGVDVSNFNGNNVSWSTVYTNNYRFAYIKSSEGDALFDASFNNNMTSSNPYGVILGVYHVIRPDLGNSYISEVNYFLNTNVAGNYVGNGFLPPAVDLEGDFANSYLLGHSVSQLAQWINSFCTQIFNTIGRWPVLYTDRSHAGSLSTYYANGTINSNIKLWIADPDHTAGNPDNLTYNWSNWPWLFHQYFDPCTTCTLSPCGLCTSNIPTGMDHNYFNGSLTDLNNLVNPSSSCTDSYESNDNCAINATSVFGSTLGAGSSNYTINANIGFAGDQDWYKINLNYTGQGLLTIDLSNLPYDYDLELYGSNCLNSFIRGSYYSSTNNEHIEYCNNFSGATTVYAKVYPYNSSNYTTNSCYHINFQWQGPSSCTAGIYQINNESPLKFYPNPTNGEITIQSDNLFENLELKIFNVIGEIVYNKTFFDKSSPINEKISLNISSGIYLITIKADDKIYTDKLIINH